MIISARHAGAQAVCGPALDGPAVQLHRQSNRGLLRAGPGTRRGLSQHRCRSLGLPFGNGLGLAKGEDGAGPLLSFQQP